MSGPTRIAQLAGRCTSGAERGHGRLWHAVENGTAYGMERAMCGATPGRHSAGWSNTEGQIVTCQGCHSRLMRISMGLSL